jgi:RecA-family ATPase
VHRFLSAAQATTGEITIVDPLYSTHDQDENDTRAMAALCKSLPWLREASRAALIVVHHVRKSIGRY